MCCNYNFDFISQSFGLSYKYFTKHSCCNIVQAVKKLLVTVRVVI